MIATGIVNIIDGIKFEIYDKERFLGYVAQYELKIEYKNVEVLLFVSNNLNKLSRALPNRIPDDLKECLEALNKEQIKMNKHKKAFRQAENAFNEIEQNYDFQNKFRSLKNKGGK